MLLPVITCLLAILILGWASHWRRPWDDRPEFVLMGMGFLLTLGLAVGIGAAVAEEVGEALPQRMDEKPSRVVRLAAARTVDSVQGSIRGGVFLLRGDIGGATYYRYYERFNDGVTPRQVRAGVGVYVYETDGAPRMEVTNWRFTRRWWRFFAFDPGGTTTDFYVPKGSIREGFQLEP